MAITTWAATTGDWDDSKFSRAWDGPNIAPAKVDLTLSSSAPGGGVSYFISPSVANLELLVSYEWDQMSDRWIDTTYTWNTGGPSPGVAISDPRNPESADLTITGFAPAQGVIYTFPVDNADLTLTGQQPAAGEGWTISPDNADLEFINSHSWNNYGGTWATSTTNWDDDSFAPDAVEAGKNQPDNADLTLTSYSPIRVESIGFPIGNADLTLSTTAPTHGQTHLRTVGAASLTGLGGGESWENFGGDWASASGAWGAGTLTPTVGVTYTFPIDNGDLVLTPNDPGWPFVKDPYYKPQVIMS
jgi:hypothetical protein